MANPRECDNRTILVIEPARAYLKRLKQVLYQAGYSVLITGVLPDASDVAQMRPDAVLLGLLPGGEGSRQDYICELKSLPASAVIPIVLWNGPGSEAHVSDGDEWLHTLASLFDPSDPPNTDPSRDEEEIVIITGPVCIVRFRDEPATDLALIR